MDECVLLGSGSRIGSSVSEGGRYDRLQDNAVLNGVLCQYSLVLLQMCIILQVASLVGRAETMAGLFYLSAMLHYAKCVSTSVGLGLSVATPLILCLASALSKELGIASFLMCPLYEFFVMRKVRRYWYNCLYTCQQLVRYNTWYRSKILET